MKAKCLASDHCSIKIAAAASKFQRPKGQPPQLAPWGSFPWAPTAHKPKRPWKEPPSQHVYILLQVGVRMIDLQSPREERDLHAIYRVLRLVLWRRGRKEHFPEILKSTSVYCTEPKANRSFGEGAHPTRRLRELLGKLYKIHISQLYPCANQLEISFVQ